MADHKRHLLLVAGQDLSGLVLDDDADQSNSGSIEYARAETSDELSDAGLMQVGELARSTGKTVRAIHLYESLGLIEPARRSKGRYRLFSRTSQVRVRWISKLQSMGLSLSEIQSIVLSRNAQPSARLASSALLDVYSSKLDEIRERIAEYQALERELESSVAFLQTCKDACDNQVAVSGCAQCERHQEDAIQVPELVAGAQAGSRAAELR